MNVSIRSTATSRLSSEPGDLDLEPVFRRVRELPNVEKGRTPPGFDVEHVVEQVLLPETI